VGGSAKAAMILGERTLTVQLDKLGPNHREMFVSLVELGFRYLELNRNEDAAKRFARALKDPIFTETPSDEHDYHKALERGIA